MKARSYYLREAEAQGWDTCELERRIFATKLLRIVPMLGEENYALDIRAGGNVMEVRWFRYARSVRPLT